MTVSPDPVRVLIFCKKFDNGELHVQSVVSLIFLTFQYNAFFLRVKWKHF